MVLRHDFNNEAPDFGEPSQPQKPADNPWAAYEHGAPTDDKQGPDRYAAMLNTTPPAQDSRDPHTPTTSELNENSAHTFPAPNSPDIQAAPINFPELDRQQKRESTSWWRQPRVAIALGAAAILLVGGGVVGGIATAESGKHNTPAALSTLNPGTNGNNAPGNPLASPTETHPPLQPGDTPPITSSIDLSNHYPGNEGYDTTINGQQVNLPLLIETDNGSREMLYHGHAYTPQESGTIGVAFLAAALTQSAEAPQDNTVAYRNLLDQYTTSLAGAHFPEFFAEIKTSLWNFYGLSADAKASVELYGDPDDTPTFSYQMSPDLQTVTIQMTGGTLYWRLTQGRPWQDNASTILPEAAGTLDTFSFAYTISDPSSGSNSITRQVGEMFAQNMEASFVDTNGDPVNP